MHREISIKKNYLHDRLTRIFSTEIVSQIFIAFDASERFNSTSAKGFTRSPPLILGTVCTRWRDITLGTPQLWTTVVVDPWKHIHHLDVVKEWLSRSGSLPLSLKVQVPFYSKPPSTSPDYLFCVLRSHSARWNHLDLELPSPLLHQLLHNLQDMPPLDSLRIIEGNNGSYEPPIIHLREPLRPRKLHSSEITEQHVPLQWDNLTYLEIAWIGVDELLHILCHADKLTHCVTQFIQGDAGVYPLPNSPVSQHSLRHIDTSVPPIEHGNFFRLLTVPFLQYLHYSSLCDDPQLQVISAFIERCDSASLETFILDFNISDQTDMDFVHSIEKMSPITHLELSDNDAQSGTGMDSFFKAFARGPATDFVPRLRELKVYTHYLSASSWSLLADLLTEVSAQESPEASVDLRTTHTTSSDFNIPSLSYTTHGKDLILPKLERHMRPLQSVIIKRLGWRPNCYEELDKTVYTRLLEVHKLGIVKLDLRMDGGYTNSLKHMASYYMIAQ